jgi:hypothetical protein
LQKRNKLRLAEKNQVKSSVALVVISRTKEKLMVVAHLFDGNRPEHLA